MLNSPLSGTIALTSTMEPLTNSAIVLILLLFIGPTEATREPPLHKRCSYMYNQGRYTSAHKYGSSILLYYSNSVSTFKLLLQAGAVKPNPGPNPDRPDSNHGNSFQIDDAPNVSQLSSKCIRYDTALIHSMNPPHHIYQYQRLPCDIWKTITDLGIARAKQTRRSKKKSQDVIDSPSKLNLT